VFDLHGHTDSAGVPLHLSPRVVQRQRGSGVGAAAGSGTPSAVRPRTGSGNRAADGDVGGGGGSSSSSSSSSSTPKAPMRHATAAEEAAALRLLHHIDTIGVKSVGKQADGRARNSPRLRWGAELDAPAPIWVDGHRPMHQCRIDIPRSARAYHQRRSNEWLCRNGAIPRDFVHIRARNGTALAKPFHRGDPTPDRPWSQRCPRPSSKAAAEQRLEQLRPGWEVTIKEGLTTLANGIPWPNFLKSETAKQIAVVKALGPRFGGDFLVKFRDGRSLWLQPSECVVVGIGKEDGVQKRRQPRARALTVAIGLHKDIRGNQTEEGR
jgi:hypothetical protein